MSGVAGGERPVPPPAREADLTAIPGEGEASPGLATLKTQPYDPGPEREKKRGVIALTLVFLMCGLVALSLIYIVVAPKEAEALRVVLEIVFGPIVGLVGAVTGFYFGEKSR